MANTHKDSEAYQFVLRKKWGIKSFFSTVRHFPAYNYPFDYPEKDKLFFAYHFQEILGRPVANFIGLSDRYGRPLF